MARRIVFIQYAGDFREASLRLASGGPETYRAQRSTVEFVEKLAKRNDEIIILTGFTSEAYDDLLPSGVRAIGAGFTAVWNSAAFIKIFHSLKPTHIILRTPVIGILKAVALSGVPTLAMIADSFPNKGFRNRLKRRIATWYLNKPSIELVGNHGHIAANNLIKAGVHANKVFAWDYHPQDTPQSRSSKSMSDTRRLIYAGALSVDKGVDDLISAVSILRNGMANVQLDILGTGDRIRLQSLAISLNLDSTMIKFHGLVPNEEVINLMAKADAVVIPSRHNYPEGLPLTIYEAFCSRTPLVASDHPMFAQAVQDGVSALVFRAGDPKHLASRVTDLFGDSDRYRALSFNTMDAWKRIQISQKWEDAIDRWLLTTKTDGLLRLGKVNQ